MHQKSFHWFKKALGSKARQGSMGPTCELKIFLQPLCDNPVLCQWKVRDLCLTLFTVSVFFLQQSSVATAAVLDGCYRFVLVRFIQYKFAFEETAHMYAIHFSIVVTYIIQQLYIVFLTCQQIVVSMCLHNPTIVYSLLPRVFQTFIVFL